MTTERLYKFLTEEGRGTYSGAAWSLPTAEEPGAWMPAITGPLVACERGYHLCRERDLIHWLGPVLYEAEYRGVERVVCDTKIVVREARLLRAAPTWNDRTARLFACDCAERVLPIFEREYPSDTRVRDAIAVARRFAEGQATREELAAASAAASAAAWAAAWDAASAAAWAAAWDAASAAAWDAASAAASAAAWDAASAAAWEWQTARLLDYINGTAQPLTPTDGTPSPASRMVTR